MLSDLGNSLDQDNAFACARPRKRETIAEQLSVRNLANRLIQCLRDERGTAMTEYLIVTAIMVPLACYLFHPDNGFYKGARDQYELTALLLIFPGP